MSTKRTYRPHKVKRIKKFGFMSRNSSGAGKKILKRRMAKGRKKLVNA